MLETTIIPAIIPQSLAHLRDAIDKLGGVAQEIQIDIVDGVFAGNKSWPYIETNLTASINTLADSLPRGLLFELDLMIVNPLQTLPIWLACQPNNVVLHIESFATDDDIRHELAVVRQAGSEAVLAISNDTPIERLLAFVSEVDGIQCMGIKEIGKQGNPFDGRVLARIKTIREAYSTLSISVDGGVNADTIILLKEAGANKFVIGSGIFNTDNPVRTYTELCRLMSRE